MELQNVCDNLVDESDGLVACMLLDLETGLTLAYAGRRGFDAAAAERIMRAAGTMFRGHLVEQFARSLPTPKPVGGFVREVQITTTNTYHFMSTLPGWPNTLLIFVTDKSLSIGLGWMAVHQAFDRLLQAGSDSPATGSAQGFETPPGTEPAAQPATAPPATAIPVPPSVEPRPARPTASAPTVSQRRPGVVPPITRSEPAARRSEPPRTADRMRPKVEPPVAEMPRERRERSAATAPVQPDASRPAHGAARAEPSEEDAAGVAAEAKKTRAVRAGARAAFGAKAKR